jgi:hypothetical protein
MLLRTKSEPVGVAEILKQAENDSPSPTDGELLTSNT